MTYESQHIIESWDKTVKERMDKALMEVYGLPLNECYEKLWDFEPRYKFDSDDLKKS